MKKLDGIVNGANLLTEEGEVIVFLEGGTPDEDIPNNPCEILGVRIHKKDRYLFLDIADDDEDHFLCFRLVDGVLEVEHHTSDGNKLDVVMSKKPI